MTGSWDVKVVTNGMPQKVATAFGELAEKLIGAEYEPIAYLGSQVVNGTNHAVLAKQVLTTGRDTINIVVLIFNEKHGAMEATLVSIDRVVEGGAPLGGVHIDPQTEIPADAMDAWNEAFGAWVGAKLEPIALLGTQVVKGTNFIFAATVTPVVPDATAKVSIVTINPMTGTVAFDDLLSTKYEASLGYAFTWLKGSLGKPLGEWP
jgi:hypothetical protein